MNRSFILALALAASGCIDFGAHTCTQDAQCEVRGVAGSCVSQGGESGYCALPDETCESDLRYVPEAGDLGGTCVGAGGTGTESSSTGETDPTSNPSTGSTDASSVTGTSSSGDGSESSSETTDMPTVDCLDADGDGYGEGEDCLGSDCDDGHPGNIDQCLYMSPTGDDGGTGTRDEPLQHFSVALPMLDPVDGPKSLVMLPGEYTPETTDRLCVSALDGQCPYTVVNGSSDPGERLRLTAEMEGSVLVLGPDAAPAVEVFQVQQWSFQGFTVARPMGAMTGTDAFDIGDTQDLDVRRVVVARGSSGATLLEVTGSSNVDVVECAVHDANAPRGYYVQNSDNVHIRRSYARLQASSLPTSTSATYRFDTTTPSEGPLRLENVVGEGGDASFRIEGEFEDGAVYVAGSVFLPSGAALATRDGNAPMLSVEDSILLPTAGDPLVSNDAATPFLRLSVTRTTGSTNGVGLDLNLVCSNCPDPPYPHQFLDSVLVSGPTLLEIDGGDVPTDWPFSFEGTAISNDGVVASFPIALPEPTTINAPECWIDPSGEVFNDRGARIVERIPGPGEDPGPLWGDDGEFPCPVEYDGADLEPTGCHSVHERIGVDGASCPTR